MTFSGKLLRTFLLILMVSALSAFLAISANAANSGGGTVNASNLNFRSEPSTASSCLGSAVNGDTVVITGSEGDWYSVLYNGIKGYMFAAYVTPSAELDIPDIGGTLNANSVRFRSAAGFDSSTIDFLNSGTSLTVTAVSGPWYAVTVNDKSGYIYSDYVELSSSVAVTAGASSEAEKIIAFAKNYLGTPYVYGGSSASGFDCSGFTSYVLKNNGYNSTRTCTTQYAQYTHISKSELRPGDLVFFASYSSWDTNHVGIYIGNNEFIHSSSGSGKVIVTNLDDWYYSTYYYGAARYLAY